MQKDKKSIINFILKKAIKMMAINHLGGKCKYCNNSNFNTLCFHHIDPSIKEHNVLKQGGSFEKIKPELEKCELVCFNCHRELHAMHSSKDTTNDRKFSKNIFLEYKKINRCEKCNYGKYFGALEFHHVDEKLFDISKLTHNHYRSVDTLDSMVKKELDKCQILCSNCHQLEHTNLEKYKKYELQIIEKSLNYKPMIKKVNNETLIKMYNNNETLVAISKFFGCAVTTIDARVKKLIKENLLQPRIPRKNQYC
jgi:hypothetical protein